MFFFQRKYKEVKLRTLKIRDEWGTLHTLDIVQGVPQLTDQEIADQAKVGLTTVITHRRD